MCSSGFERVGRINCLAQGWDGLLSTSTSILPIFTTLTKGTQQETVGKFMAKPVTLFAYPVASSPGCGVELAFRANFTFYLIPQGGTVGNNGFAFVIAQKVKVGNPSGVGYGGVGARSIAIEFNTVGHRKLNDTSQRVGLKTKGIDAFLDSRVSPFTLTNGDPYTAWVDYEPGNPGTIKVFLADSNVKPEVALLKRDLSLCAVLQPGVKETKFLFGFVASTSLKPFQMHVILKSAVQTGLTAWKAG
ncbi:unnamed protein product [Closterium sp. NIES-64]|nr:unnamed protein product [Closterium sp. NIES-64]